MSLPEKNKTCGFCKYAKPTAKPNIVNCGNEESIYRRRAEIYAKVGITVSRENSNRLTWSVFQNDTCKDFEEAPDAKKRLTALKLKGEYRDWYHEVAE